MSKRRILITGGTGQVGIELLGCHWAKDIELVAPTRLELDLSDCDRIEQYVAAGDFCAVINSGAYTAVDRAETDIVAAWKINALAPAAIAMATKKVGVPIVHISTDYVFDGGKNGFYNENDAVAPLGVYGGSKEAGEQAIRTGNPQHIILRTAWVYSAHGSNFLRTMLRLGREREQLKVVDDQLGSPTAASDVAAAVNAITTQLIAGQCLHRGTYNFVNAGTATWYEFAIEIFRLRKNAGYGVPTVQSITTDQFPTAARRPGNSRLSTVKLQHDFGVEPRDWTVALREVLASLRD